MSENHIDGDQLFAAIGDAEDKAQRGEFASAMTAVKRVLEIADPAAQKNILFEAHRVLALAYEGVGDDESALTHYQAFHDIKEQVFQEESEKRMKDLAVQYEVEKKEREAEIHRLKNVELAQLNNDLKEANRLKNEFLRVAAHDLKNPLAGIMLMSELTMKQSDLAPPIAKASEKMHDSSQRMLAIVERLLDVAKLESGTLQIDRQPVDVSALLVDCIEDNRVLADKKEQHFEHTIEPSCVVLGDHAWLSETIENLISNAIKYSPPKTTIRVRAEATNDTVRMYVQDEGPGLTDDDKEKLFGTFQRLSARPTGGEGSTGLGLSIAKQLVELHGGTIRAESELGHGSTFLIELPLQAPAIKTS